MINLSDRLNVTSNNLDFRYSKADGSPWESVEEFLSAMDDECIDINVANITILVKQVDNSVAEMWNPDPNSPLSFVKKDSSSVVNNLNTTILNSASTITSQITKAGIYEIISDIDLDNEVVNFPIGVTLRFNGGKFKNGTLNFNGTIIERVGTGYIFENLVLKGKVGCDIKASYWGWYDGYSNVEQGNNNANFLKFKSLFDIIYETRYNIIFDVESIYLEYKDTIKLENHKTYDFNGLHLYARSTTLSRYLFTAIGDGSVEHYGGQKTTYKKISDALQDEMFTNKQGLMFLDDKIPLYYRATNNDSYRRRDVLLVQNNELTTTPIMEYDNDPDTDVEISIMPISKGGFKFGNLKFDRSGATEITPLVWISYCYRPEFYNIILDSTHHEWHDNCESGTIRLEWVYAPYLHDISANMCLGDIVGTNQPNYNFVFQGATNVVLERVYANSKWHSFGNRCVNGVVCRDCVLDQWDNHVYGKNFFFENCTFFTDHLGTPEVGIMKFVHCRFKHSKIGYTSDSDVASYPTHRIFEGCIFEDQETPLVRVSKLYTPENPRQLIVSEKFPSLTLRDCILNVSKERSTYVLYETHQDNLGMINGKEMADINIENLIIDYPFGGPGGYTDTLRILLTNYQPFKVNVKIDGMKSIKKDSRVFLSTETLTRGSVQINRNQLEIINYPATLKINEGFYDEFYNILPSGLTRPSTTMIGYQFFDTTLGKPIYWNGTAWVDCTGTEC